MSHYRDVVFKVDCCVLHHTLKLLISCMQEHSRQLPQQSVVQYCMGLALKEAHKAMQTDEVPVGCVFVRWSQGDWKTVAGSHNLTNLHSNASRHCQINCLNQMEREMTKEQISQCILFVTVEPCIMCTFALNLMDIKMAYFGQYNDKFGGCGSLRKDNQFQCRGGIKEKESFELIRNFYERGNQRLPQEMRNRKKVKLDQK